MPRTFYQLSKTDFSKNNPEKLWIDKGTESFKNFCKEKDIGVYSTMSETKAAFAKRAIQSLNYIMYFLH